MRDAVLSGAGAALLPSFLVREHLLRGTLQQWGVASEHTVEIWALHASTRLASSKIRAFVKHLTDSFPEGTIESILPRFALE
jgi:DNA-binding transcriptional LysR family regulator